MAVVAPVGDEEAPGAVFEAGGGGVVDIGEGVLGAGGVRMYLERSVGFWSSAAKTAGAAEATARTAVRRRVASRATGFIAMVLGEWEGSRSRSPGRALGERGPFCDRCAAFDPLNGPHCRVESGRSR